MSAMASQITGVSIVYSTVCSCADPRKHHSSASLPFVMGIHRWPVNSPHKGPVARKMFPFDVIGCCFPLGHPRIRRSNTLDSISAAAARSKHVTEITLAGNQLPTLAPLCAADTLVLLRFQFLERLDLSNNNLQSFPEELFQVSCFSYVTHRHDDIIK